MTRPLQVAPQCLRGPFCGAIEVCLRVTDDNLGQAAQAKLKLAMLIPAASLAISVGQTYRSTHHVTPNAAHGELNPPLHMNSQTRCQQEILSVDFDLCPNLPWA